MLLEAAFLTIKLKRNTKSCFYNKSRAPYQIIIQEKKYIKNAPFFHTRSLSLSPDALSCCTHFFCNLNIRYSILMWWNNRELSSVVVVFTESRCVSSNTSLSLHTSALYFLSFPHSLFLSMFFWFWLFLESNFYLILVLIYT